MPGSRDDSAHRTDAVVGAGSAVSTPELEVAVIVTMLRVKLGHCGRLEAMRQLKDEMTLIPKGILISHPIPPRLKAAYS